MRKRTPWLELALLLAVVGGLALWWSSREEIPPEPWTWQPAWGTRQDGVERLETADVRGDARPEVVLHLENDLLTLDDTGESAGAVEYDRTNPGRGPNHRLFLKDTYGARLEVVDEADRTVWTRDLDDENLMEHRWGDLDGDGLDELAVTVWGRDGSGPLPFPQGRLEVLDGRDGRTLWKAKVHAADMALVPAEGSQRGLLFASELGTGRVWRFSATGQGSAVGAGSVLHRLAAARMDPGGPVQVLGQGFSSMRAVSGPGGFFRLECRSEGGDYLWSVRDRLARPDAPVTDDLAATRFLAADLDGDGVKEWVLRDRPDRLLVKDARGRQRATLQHDGPWTVLNGLVVTAAGDTLTAWKAVP